MRAHHHLFAVPLITVALACGSVSAPEDRGEPIALVTARLDEAPPDLGETGPLRAALVWTNGLGFESAVGPGSCTAEYVADPAQGFLQCEQRLRNNVQVTSSDVEVEMEFPLTVTLAMYELPTPIVQHIEDPYAMVEVDSDETLKGDFYSLPEAEVVLYEDGNGNEKLDLLPLGQPGPGPDRVVALSSGLDENGRAVRTVVVYKAGPLAHWIHAYYWVEYDAMPNDPDAVPEPPPRANGIYTYRYSFGPEYELGQRTMLELHALTAPDTFIGTEPEDAVITPAEQGMIQLFPAAAQWPSWLSRGCERMVTLNGIAAVSPPPDGADVQCGADAFAYASHPDNYCGQSEIAVLPVGGGSPAPDWWPCDAGGLKPGTPYRAATQRFDGDPTWLGNLGPLGIGHFFDPIWHCREGVIYHFDVSPFFTFPTTAPAPGSQVMCHSSDSFSHIPERADGCLFKYRTDLVSDPTSPHAAPGGTQWDLRQARPAWWPCDENGQLRADAGMVAPVTPAEADCDGFNEYRDPGSAPPIGSVIACESSTTFTFVPPWSDACDPKHRIATEYMDTAAGTGYRVDSPPAWWPCDDDGNFVPSAHYTAAP